MESVLTAQMSLNKAVPFGKKHGSQQGTEKQTGQKNIRKSLWELYCTPSRVNQQRSKKARTGTDKAPGPYCGCKQLEAEQPASLERFPSFFSAPPVPSGAAVKPSVQAVAASTLN